MAYNVKKYQKALIIKIIFYIIKIIERQRTLSKCNIFTLTIF